jgi:hypothetical protein
LSALSGTINNSYKPQDETHPETRLFILNTFPPFNFTIWWSTFSILSRIINVLPCPRHALSLLTNGFISYWNTHTNSCGTSENWEVGHVIGTNSERRQKKYGKMHSALIIMSILVLYHIISSGISFITRKEKKDWWKLSFQMSFLLKLLCMPAEYCSCCWSDQHIFLYPAVLNKHSGVMTKTGSYGVVNFTVLSGWNI